MVAAVPAGAQSVTEPPVTSGLFAPGKAVVPSPEHLNLLVAVTEAFDEDSLDQRDPRLTPDTSQPRGYSTLLRAAGDYAWTHPRTELKASGSSAFGSNSPLEPSGLVTSSAAVGFQATPARNATLLLNQTASYSPSYFYRLLVAPPIDLLGWVPPTGADYRLDRQTSYSYGSLVNLSHDAVKGGRLSLSGSFDRVDFRDQAVTPHPDLAIFGFDGRYSHPVSRRTELTLGYERRSGEFGYGGYTTENGGVVGVKYEQPLSATRRAEFRLDVTPAVIDVPDSAQYVAVSGRLFRLSVDANAAYPFGRTWHATGRFVRRLEYVATLSAPVFSNGARADVDGFIGRRTYVSLSAAYSAGDSALSPGDFGYDTYAGETEVRYAFTRSVAVYGGFLRYRYHLRGNIESPQGTPGRLARTGARVGLILSVPAIGRSR